ncbi:fructose-bisphosphate aldolase 2 [Quercus suber]|uniref:Fructose-bisphosphate aldolase n=1 Tax=Quercus suber TaxID=58331 RepID=A0AAW0JC38_QUESU
MASASLLKSSPVLDKSEWVKGQTLRQPSVSVVRCLPNAPSPLTIRAGSYADELVKTAGLVPLVGSNNESWCQGLDGLASRTAAYYQQGARFAKWRTVVSIPNGPTELAVKEAAWGLARYAAISQDNGLVPIVEPEILLDGEHGIERNFEVAQKVWAEVFFYLAENNVLFEGILLKPSMVTPGAECKERNTPQQIADYTLKLLQRRVPPAVPGIMASVITNNKFLSGGQSEVEATLNLNAMNQSPNPWHVSFSYARALQNTCLKTWGGRPENVKAAQEALLIRAKANSLAQLGKYTGEGESEEAKKGMFVKGYVY